MTRQLQEKTRRHYDTYPFIEGGADRIAWWQEYLHDFLPDELICNRLIVDVGSGIGEISCGLVNRGARLVCLDVSLESLRRCRQINEEAFIFHGSALELPFADASVDHAISIGVLHHTPDCRRGFHEVARVTAPGGTLVIFLYNYWNIYNLIYHSFWPVRKLIPLAKIPRWMVQTMQPFVRSHLGQSLDETQLRNLLGDKLWTPQATFHSISQVQQWGAEDGLDLVATKKFFLGYANVMCFKKRGLGFTASEREVTLKCLTCGYSPMINGNGSYTCPSCQQAYEQEGGIYKTLQSVPAPHSLPSAFGTTTGK
jgi:ubiquinone/menaquinone biosynthesis C-methylase UbiE